MADSAWTKFSKVYAELSKCLPKNKKKLLEELVNARVQHENERLEDQRKGIDEREKRITASRDEERKELNKKEEDLNKKIEMFKKSEVQQKIGEGVEAVLGVFAKAQMDAYFSTRRGFF